MQEGLEDEPEAALSPDNNMQNYTAGLTTSLYAGVDFVSKVPL
jgi:hypothetical protein